MSPFGGAMAVAEFEVHGCDRVNASGRGHGRGSDCDCARESRQDLLRRLRPQTTRKVGRPTWMRARN